MRKGHTSQPQLTIWPTRAMAVMVWSMLSVWWWMEAWSSEHSSASAARRPHSASPEAQCLPLISMTLGVETRSHLRFGRLGFVFLDVVKEIERKLSPAKE